MKRYGSWVASGAALAVLVASPLMARAADEKDAEKAKQETAAEKPKEAKPTEKTSEGKPAEKAKDPEVKVSAGPDGFVLQSGNPDFRIRIGGFAPAPRALLCPGQGQPRPHPLPPRAPAP